MNKVLVINSGSSSLKFQIFNEENADVITSGLIDRIGIDKSYIALKVDGQKKKKEIEIKNHNDGIMELLKIFETHKIISDLQEITKIGHRVVQGGEEFTKSVLVGKEELKKIKNLASLAPLHNIPNAQGIEIFQKLIPTAKNIAVFDTEFHHTIPKESYLYAVPFSWYEEHKIRRYGMHGTSHKYITHEVARVQEKNVQDMNLIICHLGNGASLTAVKNGKSLQTSMGLTPLEGLVMGTRSGSLDPAIYDYVNKTMGYSIEKITNILNKESGMLGLSGVSSDFRDIKEAIDSDNQRAKIALDVYITRIVEYIGSYYARLQGVDTIVFTAGVGENSPFVRELILKKLEFLGIDFDIEANEKNELYITKANSKIKVMIVSTDEEYQIYKETKKF